MRKIGIQPNLGGKIGGEFPSNSTGVDLIATKLSQHVYFQMLQRNVGPTKIARIPWKQVMTSKIKKTKNATK